MQFARATDAEARRIGSLNPGTMTDGASVTVEITADVSPGLSGTLPALAMHAVRCPQVR